MIASSGAMFDMSVTWVAIPTSAIPVIRPRPAVISGIPAAISEPNVSSRMISAAITPTAVAGPTLKPSALSITCPPAAIWSPGTCTLPIASSTGCPVLSGSRLARLS